MGVTGLWRLVEPSGKPVPLEALENKVLAVDISIWLHQALKGFHDSEGAPLPNAHLLGVYHRICKLVYFKIKPIFVFDGGVPNLKKETISKRQQLKTKKLSEADRLQQQLLTVLLKHSAVNQVLSENAKSKIASQAATFKTRNKGEDIYKLPSPTLEDTSDKEEESSSDSDVTSSKQWDLHTIDEKSPHFKSLPADVRHDILTELKETRKQSSWGRIHEMPKESNNFANFQMKRLLKRYSVQLSLEEAQREMGGNSMSLVELEALLKDQGVVISNDSLGNKIASNENMKYVLIKNMTKAIEEAKKKENSSNNGKESISNAQFDINEMEERVKESETNIRVSDNANKGEFDYQKDLETAIQLSLQDIPSTSKNETENSILDQLQDNDIDLSSDSEKDIHDLKSARNYIVEYSGLTMNALNKILATDSNASKNILQTNSCVKHISEKVTPKLSEEIPSLVENQINLSTNFSNQNSKLTVTDLDLNETENNKTTIDSYKSNSNSESESDDFLEVSEPMVFPNKNQPNLEIVFNPKDAVEDDMFGDIFIENKNKQSCNFNNENSSQSLFSNSNQQSVSNSYTSIETNKSPQNLVASEKIVNALADKRLEKENNLSKEIDQFLSASSSLAVTQEEFLKDSQTITRHTLKDIETNLQKEKDDLTSEMMQQERLAKNPNEQIYQETQELLQLFGVPYIIAPMEAEAQCAFLEYVGITNGTITDDSDIWLFGGQTVYKNFFDQRKVVMEFQSDHIQQNFKLTREKMIQLALLVGSDYTTGLQGIGPVTALEVLAAFPSTKSLENNTLNDTQILSGLINFRKWLEGEQKLGLGRVGLRNKLKNVSFIKSFPSMQVVQAYLKPTIDESKEPFSWAKPDKPGLIEFARKKFGWPPFKSETILDPILKRLNENRSQKSIKDYFQSKFKREGNYAESRMSKRVKQAIDKIGGEGSDEVNLEEPVKQSRKRKKPQTEMEDLAQKASNMSSDEDIEALKIACEQSEQKVKQINTEVKKALEVIEKTPKIVSNTPKFHKKEVIPQKERTKVNTLRNKLKAIEVFRKSNKGPGYVKKRKMISKHLKEDAELSESSSD